MLEHIVKNHETLEDILNMYHLGVDELKNANLHITDFNHLASGMKIKIPLLTEEVEQVLETTESFVKRYYPKMEEIEKAEPEKKEKDIPKVVEEKPMAASSAVELNRRAYPGILPPRNPYKRP